MSTRDKLMDVRERLDECYPGDLALLLIPVSGPQGGKGGGKRPLEKGWNEKAMARFEAGEGRDEHLAMIVGHVSQGENVGWVVPAGALVLDADDERSVEYLDAVLPEAPKQRTRSGAHYLIQPPEGIEVRAMAKVGLAEGVSVDLRVAGRSQIVVEPSVHATGVRYEWDRKLPESLEDLPACPPEIVEALRSRFIQHGSADVSAERYPSGTRNDSLFRLGCRLRRDGLSENEIRMALLRSNDEQCDPPLDEREVAQIAASCARYEPGDVEPLGASGRPVITINEGQARVRIGAMVDAVVAANDPPRLFRRAGNLVWIGRSDLGIVEAQIVVPDDFLNIFNESADFQRRDGRNGTTRHAQPPKDLMSAAVRRALSEDRLPALRAVTATPILREDGTIVASEGYDPVTGSYFAPRQGFQFGDLPEKPTGVEAEEALAKLLDLFNDFLFATETDRANFLAVIVTAVCRTWFPTVPLVVFEAPIQGAGKTLLAEAVRMLIAGVAGVGAAPEQGRQNEAEWRKRITAALLSAPSVVIFDNVVGVLGGPSLAALATSRAWEDRILGRSETVELANAATWLFTSNNASVDADLIRRTIFIRLDPRDAAPHLRTGFRIPDLLGHIENHRGELLAAAFTIVRHWIVEGRPPAPAGTPTLGSFERWSATVPAILGAVGIEGVLGDLDERAVLLRDPADEELAAFLESWWRDEDLRDGATAREILAAGGLSVAGMGFDGQVSIVLPSLVHRDGGAKSLGRYLSFRRDRLVVAEDGASYAVRQAGRGRWTRGMVWRVERTSPSG